jgi:hypothetical protein
VLFHKDIFFPQELKLPIGRFPLQMGRHARENAERRGLPVPYSIDLNATQIVEVETYGNSFKIKKLVLRLPLNSREDLCIVAATDEYPWFVKTLWKNAANDVHPTLNRSRYFNG